jgi:hypothetical protein
MQRGTSPTLANLPSRVLLLTMRVTASLSSLHHHCHRGTNLPTRCQLHWGATLEGLGRWYYGGRVCGWVMETVEHNPRRALVVIRSEVRLGDEATSMSGGGSPL